MDAAGNVVYAPFSAALASYERGVLHVRITSAPFSYWDQRTQRTYPAVAVLNAHAIGEYAEVGISVWSRKGLLLDVRSVPLAPGTPTVTVWVVP
jgi:hypothetical protein